MPKNINQFIKGVNSDVDVLVLDKQTPRDIQNMRILDADGKGLVLTNIAGNEERFSLSTGYVPIGSVEYNGIIYIASFCPPNGRGELGCYPAPEALIDRDCSLSGWDSTDKRYSRLTNFTSNVNPRATGAVSQYFSTELFNFADTGTDKIPQVEIIAREDYDGSVNLYICGERNPIRVFNTGFDQNGECTKPERRYWNGSFPNEVNLLNESEKHLNIEFLGTGDSGRLRGGGWIFYFRYVNENYDATSFFAETNNVIIMPGKHSVEGWRRKGIEGTVETTKSANFRIKNVDPTYSYLEIGFQHNNDDSNEYGIISERIALNPGQTTYDISITGNEQYYNVDVSEIIKTKPTWDGAMSHEQLENRYFAANLFDTTDLDDERIREIAEFSSLITPNYNDNKRFRHKEPGSFDDAVGSNFYKGIYNKEENVYNYTGYFRGESYPFGIVYVLNTGREIGAFPIEGRDDWDLSASTINDEGIYRFPTIQDSNTVQGDFINVMGISFNMNLALNILPQWMQDNISGFYFVRGERQRSLLYQGRVVPAWAAYVINGIPNNNQDYTTVTPFIFNYKPMDLLQNENVHPAFNGGTIQFFFRFDSSLLSSAVWTYAMSTWRDSRISRNKSAFLSIDHFFLKSLPINKGFLIENARIQNETGVYKGNDNVYSGIDFYFMGDKLYQFPDPYTAGKPQLGYVDLVNVAPWEPTNTNMFCSYYKEGTKTQYQAFEYAYMRSDDNTKFFEIKNEEVAFPSYIGVEVGYDLSSVGNGIGGNFDNWLLNVYLADPNPPDFDITKLYDVSSVQYSKISKFYRLSDIITNPSIVNNHVQYRGDCFLQRSFMKVRTNPKLSPSMFSDGMGPESGSTGSTSSPFSWYSKKTFAFGQVVGTISENTINAECRLESPTKKFCPGSTVDIYSFAIKDTNKESELINRGYNQQLSSKKYRGINLEIPFFKEEKPSAIMYSNVHQLGSFQDGYRLIDIAAVKEYDYRLGSIVSIMNHNGTLVSIQEFGINKHLVNERALLNQGDSSGELLLGSGQVLDSKAINLSD